MYKVFFPVLAAALSGCTTPPIALPDSQEDYRPPAPYTTTADAPCEITVGQPEGVAPQVLLIDGATRKAYTRGCQYSGYIDAAKDFGAISDQTTLGLVTSAGVGVLTNAHSDVVKALGALTGLSLGSKLYVNPQVQMTTYGKAAIAAQCLGDSLSELLTIVETHQGALQDLTKLESQANEFANAVEGLRYSPGAQKMVISLNEPTLIADIFALTKNAQQDAENKKQALKFIRSAHRLTNANLRAIHTHVVATLNAQAFDIDAATKKIATTSVPTKELLEQVGAAGKKKKNSAPKDEEGNAALTDAENLEVGLLEKISESESPEVPYLDIIRINNEYTDCMTALTK